MNKELVKAIRGVIGNDVDLDSEEGRKRFEEILMSMVDQEYNGLMVKLAGKDSEGRQLFKIVRVQ